MEHERTSPTADSSQASAELHELARRLMRQACELGSFKSAYEVSASARGLPAIMRVLMEADGPVSPGELARRTGVTDARIANALRALEQLRAAGSRLSGMARRPSASLWTIWESWVLRTLVTSFVWSDESLR